MRNRWRGILFAVCGIALVAWVLWDAGSVQQHLPFGARMDEASGALLALALGGAFLALAVRALRPRAATNNGDSVARATRSTRSRRCRAGHR